MAGERKEGSEGKVREERRREGRGEGPDS